MKLLDEFDYLIHLVGCAINGKQPQELPDGMDFANIFELAREHEIANLAFYSIDKLQAKPVQPLYEKWSTAAALSFTRDVNQQFALDEIIEKFKAANIRSLEAQGTVVKQYYPESHYRTMSDIDLLIDQCNLQRAGEILQKLGYKFIKPYDYEIDAYREPNINIELHCKLMDYEQFEGFFDNAFDIADSSDSYRYFLNDNDFFLYNMFHLIKHYTNTGCGIRRVLDIFVLEKALDGKLDTDYLIKQYDKYGVRNIADSIMRLSEVWFGESEMTDDLQETARQIKDSGTHGNRIVGMRNELRKDKNRSRLGYILRRTFPKASDMYNIYPKLKKHKAMLPLYYIYRPIDLGIINRKSTGNKLKEIMK